MLHLLCIFNAWVTDLRQQVCSTTILYNTVALHESKTELGVTQLV